MTFNKPIYIGFINLEKSKLLMYELYYDVLQTCYSENNLVLHYTDTDSFIHSGKPRTGTTAGDLKELQRNNLIGTLNNIRFDKKLECLFGKITEAEKITTTISLEFETTQ